MAAFDAAGNVSSQSQAVQVTTSVPTGSCSSPQNLAIGESASQSSTYGNGGAGLAVDGNTTGNSPWTADLQHTQNQSQPWWEVDLGQLSEIQSIQLYNRTSGFQDRLKNFYILLSSAPFNPNASLADHLANGAITSQFFSGSAGAVESFTVNESARYVRIQLSGVGVLHMAEVQVIGCASGSDPCEGAAPVSITPAGPFAENAGTQQLQASPAGGTWSGDVSLSGVFDPSMGAGTYSVSYSYTSPAGCTQVDQTNITVTPVGGCSSPANLALNKVSSQSSTYGNGLPALANDGNRTGSSPWSADLQHTQNESQPWWQVDLGLEGQIDQVRLFNRTGSNLNRLKDFYILVSSSPFPTGASLSSLLADGSITRVFFSGNAGSEEIVALNTVGRYVRIQLSGSGILHMAEVEVIGCGEVVDPCQNNGSTNLAINRTASQSSTYGFGVASIGVDGDRDGSRGPWTNASIIHTQREAQPWWQVDLGSQGEIQEVHIYNRTDCCQPRLKDFYVLVSNIPFSASASLTDLLNNPSVTSTYFPGNAGDSEQIAIGNTGRYVRIQLSSSNEVLHVAEIEVMGCPAASQVQRLAASGEGVEELKEDPFLHLFPNPTSKHVNIVVENASSESSYRFEIYTMTGQRVWERAGSTYEKVDLSGLAKGLYLIKVQSESWTEVKELLVR